LNVSILIPAYNHEKYIKKTLDSIYQETCLNFEVVILDDGSTDSTKEVIEHWIAAHPDFNIQFYSRENKGLTVTLNELIRYAKGQYLRLFSSDDMIVKGSTQKMIDFIAPYPNIYAVFSDVRVISKDDDFIEYSALKSNGSDIKKYYSIQSLNREIISNWSISGPAVLIKRKWYDENGFYDEDLLVEDWYLCLKLVSKNALIFMNDTVAYYRVHGENTCKTKDIKRLKSLYYSQITAAERCLPLFTGSNRTILKSEIFLLKAKFYLTGSNLFFGFLCFLSSILCGIKYKFEVITSWISNLIFSFFSKLKKIF
jgi:glycosyltransferase involved in cell wall biosynthesis